VVARISYFLFLPEQLKRHHHQELAGLAGIVVCYDDVIMGLKPKVVIQGERVLLG